MPDKAGCDASGMHQRSNAVGRRKEAVHMVSSTPPYPIRFVGVVRWLKADVKITVPRWLLISIRDQEQLVSRHQVMVSRMKYDSESIGALSHLRFGYGLAVSTEVFTVAAPRRVWPSAAGLVGIALCEKNRRYNCEGHHRRC
ncbi:hypothetical protein SAMN02927900_03540 [Rhizobium mongolense subsp. loessense]|uniref:Uncharacterized protein n=1 Tax=Rhizobium mongolense subsp. loessense TaxID=158890 RepID=A0A1G4SA50_9HYPH|nr:hypothetical protein SAMN02927900_03540 [Rhizobium mongolense subsp. loessense]